MQVPVAGFLYPFGKLVPSLSQDEGLDIYTVNQRVTILLVQICTKSHTNCTKLMG